MSSNPISPGEEATSVPTEISRGSRIISRLLPPAIRLWLQTQFDHLEGLDFCLDGNDRQILAGYVPEVSISAHQAVYKGLQVSQVQVTAADIRVNLGQVVRGKPLRLLQPFPVRGQVCLWAHDIQASLRSPLLAQGLQDVLQRLIETQPDQDSGLGVGARLKANPALWATVANITLAADQLTLTWPPAQPGGDTLVMQTGLTMRNGRWLCLCQPTVAMTGANTEAITQGDSPSPPLTLTDLTFDLGPYTDIQHLAIKADRIELKGMVQVIPAD